MTLSRVSCEFRIADMRARAETHCPKGAAGAKPTSFSLAWQASLGTLTAREREGLALVSSGLMNKQIAAELGLAEITVKIHRGHIMKKMGAKSLADLVRKAETLGVHRIKS